MAELIIAEKPAAAKKIAFALSRNVKVLRHGIVPYYHFTLDDKEIYVASAVGHLFTLDQTKNGWNWPTFETEWLEMYKVNKAADYTKEYIDLLNELIQNVSEITIATDYDIEGELIGYNILRFIANKTNANRMKFSTLTQEELRSSYFSKFSSIDLHNALAGETRHIIDWYYGINLSRALISSTKKAGKFIVLSTGRVQGPALNLLVKRELEIEQFKPDIYYVINAKLKTNHEFIANYIAERIEDEDKAKAIYDKIKKEKNALIDEVEINNELMYAPTPFDLTTLQSESYRIYKIKPQETLNIAQKLYTSSYISYPRTSSQILDPKINFKKIIANLVKLDAFSDATKLLNKGYLRPRNGKKTDPAHPAIYPTGVMPKALQSKEWNVYNLIVRRFLATFYTPAKKEVKHLKISIKDEPFKATLQEIKVRSWLDIYPFFKIEENNAEVDEKSKAEIVKLNLKKAKTKPPRRYSQAALIKELERRNLGTKATRAQIIETLYSRKYVLSDPIKVTALGKTVIETLEKYVPKIIDEEMTRELELKMEKINTENDKTEVITNARKALLKILDDFKAKELKIGKELIDSLNKAVESTLSIGKCPKCGGNLIIKDGKTRKFVACDNCGYRIFVGGGIKRTLKKVCSCGFKLLSVQFGKKMYHVCFNENCKDNKPEKIKLYYNFYTYDKSSNNRSSKLEN